MTAKLTPEVSKRNKYWINKHRHYELKHFCLQYPNWKKIIRETYELNGSPIEWMPSNNMHSDPTANAAETRMYFNQKIDLLEDTAKEADQALCGYILIAVTEGLSYDKMKTRFNIPCGKDMFYDRCRRFYWLLDQKKN